MDTKEKFNRTEVIANAAKHLLEKNGIYSFGMLLTEDDKELGCCYQKEGAFVFVNDRGEETKRPLMDESERWLYDLGLVRFKLLQYNENEMTYLICNPSCENYSSVYYKEWGNKYYIICPNNICLPINMESGIFEYIDKSQYILLTYHQTDEIRNTDLYDGKCHEFYQLDIFFNKRTNEIWECNGFIEYKKYVIINGWAPCTIVYDDSMAVVYKRKEDAVFCRLGKFAYLIFGSSEIVYNIDTKVEKTIGDFDKYDNYEVYFDYLIKYRITHYAKEEIIQEDERDGQYEEWIPEHDVTDAIIYNSNLEIVRELHMPGVYNEIVRKDNKVLIKCCVEGKYFSKYYYDVDRPEYIKHDNITRKTYSVADIVEKQITDDIIIEEVLNSSKANDYASLSSEQIEFDDEDEMFECRIIIRKENEWGLLNDDVYSSITSQCFKHRGEALCPTYLLAIRNRKRHEYDLFVNGIKLVDKGKYSNEHIQVCKEGHRIIFSNNDQFGIIGDGKILVPSIYDSIEYYHDYEDSMSLYVIQDGNTFGIIDNDGYILLKCEYAMIKCYYDWYGNLYILISDDNNNYSWACCDKGSIHIDGIAVPDENSIIRPSWVAREGDGDEEVIVQVNYNIQTGEFGEDEERFRYSKEGDYSGWTDQELRDAADIAYEGHSRLELGLED